MSDSLRPHKLQHARLPCLSPSPGVCSNSCPLDKWCHPTISSSVPTSLSSLNLAQYQGLSNELALWIRWSKHGSFSFSINHLNECSVLISFVIDWFDLLAVQGTLKSILQFLPISFLAGLNFYFCLLTNSGVCGEVVIRLMMLFKNFFNI